MKKLNNLLMVALFSFAFLLGATDMRAQCDYDPSDLDYDVFNTAVYIYPWGGVSGDFLVLWRVKGDLDWNNTGLTSSHVITISDLEECTKYEFCVIEKCGPGQWSELDPEEIFCIMTLCECPCDSPIEITGEAGAFNTSAYLYAYGYDGIPHYFEYWPKNPDGPSTTTAITEDYFTEIEDLEPCREYGYRLIVYCPEYEECPEACEVQGGAEVSDVHCFMTTGCHEDEGKCCDYLFMVDRSGSMSQEQLDEVACQIEAVIDEVQHDCGDCASEFAISTWQDDREGSVVLNDFECDPNVDLGDAMTGPGTDIGNATGDAADWLEDGTLNTDNRCLHVIIYTDTGCSDYDDEFAHGVQELLDAGATTVSVVALENHGCEGVLGPIEAAGGTYTEIEEGDCTEGLLGNDSESRSSTPKRIYIYDPNNPDVLLKVIEPGSKVNTNALNVYPMPFVDVINIDYTLETRSDITVEIYNSIGELVLKEVQTNRNKGKQTISINNELPQGSYSYILSINNETHSGKLLKI